MNIIFVTDLHGCLWKYEKLYHVAQKFGADVVIHSGDMLPKHTDLFQQDQFITRHLNTHFQQFDDAKIFCLCYLGNDDLMIFDTMFEEMCRQYHYVSNIAQRKVTIQDIDFIGMNWVVDYPFRLKDRCRMDTKNYIFQRQLGSGLLSTPHGWKEIDDWYAYVRTRPTIQEELQRLPKPRDMQQSVYVIHMPPAHLGLDVCGHGEHVGSQALYQFLETYQPRMALHGHIHESPDMSGIWKAQLGATICIQPGQMDRFTYITIDTETMEIERHIQ